MIWFVWAGLFRHSHHKAGLRPGRYEPLATHVKLAVKLYVALVSFFSFAWFVLFDCFLLLYISFLVCHFQLRLTCSAWQ
jgi:hypothetical protein